MDKLMSVGERNDAAQRVQSANNIALHLFHEFADEMKTMGALDENKCEDLINKCIRVSKIVDEALFKEIEPFI